MTARSQHAKSFLQQPILALLSSDVARLLQNHLPYNSLFLWLVTKASQSDRCTEKTQRRTTATAAVASPMTKK